MMSEYADAAVLLAAIGDGCPGEACPFCTGEMCSACGAGMRARSPRARRCEHDVLDRHEAVYAAQA